MGIFVATFPSPGNIATVSLLMPTIDSGVDGDVADDVDVGVGGAGGNEDDERVHYLSNLLPPTLARSSNTFTRHVPPPSPHHNTLPSKQCGAHFSKCKIVKCVLSRDVCPLVASKTVHMCGILKKNTSSAKPKGCTVQFSKSVQKACLVSSVCPPCNAACPSCNHSCTVA